GRSGPPRAGQGQGVESDPAQRPVGPAARGIEAEDLGPAIARDPRRATPREPRRRVARGPGAPGAHHRAPAGETGTLRVRVARGADQGPSPPSRRGPEGGPHPGPLAPLARRSTLSHDPRRLTTRRPP